MGSRVSLLCRRAVVAFTVCVLGACGNQGSAPTSPPGEAVRGPAVQFLEQIPVGKPVGDTPSWISNVRIVDLDQDGLNDVVVTEGRLNQVSWVRQRADGSYDEQIIASEVRAPAHVEPSDIDQDGDLDLLVAAMGVIYPSNDKIGSVIVLEDEGNQMFTKHVLLEDVARVTDVEPGDLDQDGDIDLAVGQFGYDDGEIRWMENKGNWVFESVQLLNRSGTIHTPVADMDGDGDLDIVAVVSQQWEEIYVFENDGAARFETRRVYAATHHDFGSSGISLVDLDLDGDLDILYTNGDACDASSPLRIRPGHGAQWLENMGGLVFEYHRLADFRGAYSARAFDADRDGDLDIFVSSMFNAWDTPEARSLAWFENDGSSRFTMRELASAPTHLITMDHGDMDGDGWVDLVTGGMYPFRPLDRMGRVTFWRNGWSQRPPGE